MSTLKALDGMTAAAYAAYALSEAAVIFPITPASKMAETVEKWSAEGKLNLIGHPVDVTEMQSEKGVAGMVHGCLAGGALTSTFTASQGLMLMIPNMYKISGEMLPGVFHVTTRSLAAHALSIFGDHQDVMAVRQAGFAMLGSVSVQECMDLSLVAHLSAIDASLPFVHFFDGFRTSDEICTVETIEQEDMRPLVNWDNVKKFREAAMEPEHPHIRGTAQNPDIYFQNREAPNKYYDALPGIVQANMDKVAKLTGRAYHLFDYVGASDAERVVVTMNSSCSVVEAAVKALIAQGEKVGLVKVRLYRPFSAEALMDAIPQTAKVVCALDRTKEPGSQAEPLHLDVALAVMKSGRAITVMGGRYGLSSKDFTPTMAAAVFANMASSNPIPRFTVGINDDVTYLSLPQVDHLKVASPAKKQCIFYGFGSDGMVGANKQAAKIVGDKTGQYVQEYSWFDSKKSGGLTISYVRFNDAPINAPYLIDEADFVLCSKDIYLARHYPMLAELKDGGIFVLNSSWTKDQLEQKIPAWFKRELTAKHVQFYIADASKLAQELGLGARVNMIMQTIFFKLSGVMDFDQAVAALKDDVKVTYAAKGADVVNKDLQAIDKALTCMTQVEIPAAWANAGAAEDGVDGAGQADPEVAQAGGAHAATNNRQERLEDPAYVKDVFWPMERLEGNDLPVSALHPAGFVEPGTAAYEKRTVATHVPEWNCHNCVECYECSFVCPHGAIRPYVATPEELKDAPEGFDHKPCTFEGLEDLEFHIQVYPEDCVGCGSCAFNCPAPGKALFMKPLETQLEQDKVNLAFAQENISLKEDLIPADTIPGTQLKQPLFEFSGCCAGCGETPYVKLLTQLFGDRLIMANATGCSSIYGAYMPAMPYTTNAQGHGPAWGNSLFEDNGEYGFGIAKGVTLRRQTLEGLVDAAIKDTSTPAEVATLLKSWWDVKDDAEASYQVGQAVCEALVPHAAKEPFKTMLEYKTMFGKKSVWAVGGDGWAYDIDYDGLDEVLAKGQNINILVLDTEGYSNTGGEMSKATQLGSVSGFALNGKPTPKKNMGRMLMNYGYVYVAQVAFGANMQQTIDALREAEAYDGPSIVIALCPCISWGLKEGMHTVTGALKEAVATGYWPLWRFDPSRAAQGEDPLTIDSPVPEAADAMEDFLAGQNRYAQLADRKPELSKRLQSELAKDSERNYEELTRTVDVYKPDQA